MFNKLRNRISRPVYWATIAVIILLSAGIFTPAAINMKNNFINNARENILQASSNMEYSFNVIFSGINQLAGDTETVEVLEREGEKHLSERTKNYMEALRLSQKVLGVYIYEVALSLNGGLVDYSKNISLPVLYSDLKQNVSVKNFILSGNDKVISVRSEYISGSFAQSKYPVEKGIITCMQKVYSTDLSVIGLVAVDISPDIIYGFYNYSSAIFSGSKTYLIDDTDTVLHNNIWTNSDINAVNNAKKNSKDYFTYRNYYIFDTEFVSSDTVIVHLIRNNAYFNIFWISLIILLLTDAAVITAAYFISKRITLKVVLPIENIKAQMQEEDTDNES